MTNITAIRRIQRREQETISKSIYGTKIDRETALSVLKDLSKYMYPSHDLLGNKTLVITRDQFEVIRAKYLK